jgi:hypothetical protein
MPEAENRFHDPLSQYVNREDPFALCVFLVTFAKISAKTTGEILKTM